jgi:hypothetical protein
MADHKIQQAWMSVLGVVSSAEHRLMEALGLNPENPLGRELIARVQRNRDALERRVDEGVKAAVARVRAPVDRELQAIRTRLEHVQARLDKRKSRKR